MIDFNRLDDPSFEEMKDYVADFEYENFGYSRTNFFNVPEVVETYFKLRALN